MRWNKSLLAVFAMLFVLIAFMPSSVHAQGGQRAWQGTAGSPERFFLEVAKGNIPGHSVVHKFGHGLVSTTLVPVSTGLVYQTPLTGVSLEIVSSSLLDALDDTGAWEYTVMGIDANYDLITQVIPAHATLGTTAVALPIDMLRVFRWYVSASGSYATQSVGSHAGTLTLRVAGAGATWDTIGAAPFPAGQSEIGAYTVPDGFRAYIVQQEFDVDGTKSVDILVFKRQGIDVVVAPFTPMRKLSHYVGVTGHTDRQFQVPLNSFPARTDFGYMGKVASGTADVTVHFLILLIADDY